MQNNRLGIIAGLVVGLLVGTGGALAYSHFLGDGSLLADLQAKLDAANAAMAKTKSDTAELKQENIGLTAQVDQLQTSNTQLKQSGGDANQAAAATQQPSNDMAAIAGVLRNMFRGGAGQNPQQRMLLFKTRLHLTAEQQAAIQASMDADNKARRDIMRAAFENGGRPDPTALAKANTLDKTLTDVLNPEQQRQYQQLQTDEKTARADSMANSQVNAIMPLLQLNDTQKDQMYTAIYQQQLSAPDPNSLITNPNAVAALTSQAQATQSALAKVLSADQMALYQEQNQAQAAGYGGRNRGNGGQANANNGQAGAVNTPAPAPNGGAGTVPTVTYATATPQVSNPNGTVNGGTSVSGYVATPAAASSTTAAAPATTAPAATSNASTTNAPAASAPSTNAAPAQ